MKGSEDIIWMLTFAFIVILVSTVVIVFFSKPVSGIVDEATKLQAKYWSYQIAGVISLSEASDDGIQTKLDLPRTAAKITISSLSVNVEFGVQNKYTHYFTEPSPLKSGVKLVDYITDPSNPLETDKIVIDTTKQKSLIVQKINGDILIKAENK